VGLWRVMSAKHRTTGREVAVWVAEKRGGEAVEGLKREVSSGFWCMIFQFLDVMLSDVGRYRRSGRAVSRVTWQYESRNDEACPIGESFKVKG
jgi:hypothetical protein